MSPRPVTHGTVEQSRRSARAIIARAYLFKADADAQKRIDRYIDYFGGSGARRSVVADPWGESLQVPENGCSASPAETTAATVGSRRNS